MRRKKYLHIAVIGNIASGKTTASKILADAFKAEIVLEPFIDNPFLPDFINDKKRWAFANELYFLRDRLKQHENVKMLLQKNNVIVDSGMLMSTWVYSKNQYLQGYFTENEWQFYLDLHKELKKSYIDENLVIYVKAHPELSMKRIRKRGRDFEKGYDFTYLNQLYTQLEELKDKLKEEGTPLLEFDTGVYDLTDLKNKKGLIRLAKKKLKEIKKQCINIQPKN